MIQDPWSPPRGGPPFPHLSKLPQVKAALSTETTSLRTPEGHDEDIGGPKLYHLRHLNVSAPRQPGNLVVGLHLDYPYTWFLYTLNGRVVVQLR